MSSTPLRKLGKYELVEELARGSAGAVFLGFDPLIHRPVAVKVAIASSLRDRETSERYRRMFFNEAHTAGRLRHPNILNIFDAGIDQDTCYIVMELVPGGLTLRQYTKPERLLPVEEVARIIFDCAKALDYAHHEGVIHRDIKPSNILVNPDKSVKVADFSIAHVMHADLSDTLPLGFIGSPRYMSPEQIQEDEVSHQTDLFSLGVVAFELLTGQHPFAADTFSRLVHAIVNQAPPLLQDLRPGLPEALQSIIARALEKDTRLRYRTGLDMAADLSAAIATLEHPQDDVPLKQRFDTLRALSFFSDFNDVETWEVARSAIWQNHPADALVLREGEIEDSFYVIAAGRVEVLKGELPIQQLGPGVCLGEMGYISKARRTAAVRTLERTRLIKVTGQLIAHLSKDCQLRLYQTLLRTLVERLMITTDQVVRR